MDKFTRAFFGYYVASFATSLVVLLILPGTLAQMALTNDWFTLAWAVVIAPTYTPITSLVAVSGGDFLAAIVPVAAILGAYFGWVQKPSPHRYY